MKKNMPRTLAAFSIAAAAFVCASAGIAQAPLPQPHTQGSVTYLNGGAGSDEVDYIKSQIKDYSLALMFSLTGGDYTANVAVTIKDARGNTVFEAPSTGPFLLLKLPAGKYTVVANYQNQPKTQQVAVDRSARTPVGFVWS